jgi:2-phosphoglycerate kinase
MREGHWDVLLVGGAAGVGKTAVSYPLAHRHRAGLTEVDDIVEAIERLTTPEQQPVLHYWSTHPDETTSWSAERILEQHLAVANVLSPAVEAVVANHLRFGPPVVLEGDYLLPALAAQASFDEVPADGRVRAVFVHEPEESQVLANFLAREPDEGEQTGRARVSWLYGQWLAHQATALGLPVVTARPWETLLTRATDAIG